MQVHDTLAEDVEPLPRSSPIYKAMRKRYSAALTLLDRTETVEEKLDLLGAVIFFQREESRTRRARSRAARHRGSRHGRGKAQQPRIAATRA
jgi:hypothetical protein